MSQGYHDTRLESDPKRAVVWRALWRYYFSHRIGSDETVLDLGSGYGDFINNVKVRHRLALDNWPDFAKHLEPDVEAIVAPVTDLSAIGDGSVDYAFASNLFEHIPKSDLATVLAALRNKFSVRGRLTMLQPNYRYCSSEYFDDYTHITAWSHASLADFLRSNGYEVLETRPRFLPLTVKSRFAGLGALDRRLSAFAYKADGQADAVEREAEELNARDFFRNLIQLFKGPLMTTPPIRVCPQSLSN